MRRVGLLSVAEVARGRMTRSRLRELLGSSSAYGAQRIEGLYLRRESAGFLRRRAKIVRAGFREGITEHWTHKPMTVNERQTAYGWETPPTPKVQSAR